MRYPRRVAVVVPAAEVVAAHAVPRRQQPEKNPAWKRRLLRYPHPRVVVARASAANSRSRLEIGRFRSWGHRHT